MRYAGRDGFAANAGLESRGGALDSPQSKDVQERG